MPDPKCASQECRDGGNRPERQHCLLVYLGWVKDHNVGVGLVSVVRQRDLRSVCMLRLSPNT